MSGTTLVVLSDIQVPYHDKRAVKNVIEFVRQFKPDGLLCVGDELDSPQPSRWTKGMAGEYEMTLQGDIDLCHDIMADFRSALGDKPFVIQRSNHGDRIETYVKRYAPALRSLRGLRVDELLGYADLGIEYSRRPREIAPGWLMMHGDEGGLVRSPGGTALSLARKTGKSVICGHTHRLGIQPESIGVNGQAKTIVGFETGHLMNMKKASYLSVGSANWQAGFGILYADGRNVTPVAVPIHRDGTFRVDGRVWGA